MTPSQAPISASLPSHPSGPSTPHAHSKPHSRASSQIYVLSADGSRLFLLDPTIPDGREDPPAYHTIQSPARGVTPLPLSPDQHTDPAWQIGVADSDDTGGGPSSPRSVRVHTLPSIRSGASSASLMIPHSHSDMEVRDAANGRNRAYTTSTPTSSAGVRSGRTMSASGGARQSGRSGRIGLGPRAHSHTPQTRASGASVGVDEDTPLLAGVPYVSAGRRGMTRSIICGEVDEGDERTTWGAGWQRYWNPLVRAEYWRCALHLLVLNFPFALLIWPFLFAGTVAGTALLITLPIGAAVWWLTLILARTAARLEIMMQTHHYSSSLPSLKPVSHPIFHRHINPSLRSPCPTSHSGQRTLDETDEAPELIWETGFIKCSYAMFCDYYSYSALSYFVLLKPLITLFSTIAIIVLGAVSLGTILGVPVYLRALRRWGRWQAGFAIDNL